MSCSHVDNTFRKTFWEENTLFLVYNHPNVSFLN